LEDDTESLDAAVVTACLLGIPASRAAAQALDQQPTRESSGVSDLDCDFCQNGSLVIAENVVFTEPGWIAELTIWGGYVDDLGYDDLFTVQIFADTAGGLPATPALVAYTGLPATREATGLTVPFSGSPVDEYRFILDLPAPPLLPTGTYWIEIANDSTGQTGEFVWGYGALDSAHGRAGSALSVSGAVWFPTPTHFNLQIPSVLFADGFESGDPGAWTTSQP
jgi:hypothetical protein